MKKILTLIAILAIFTFSCEKENITPEEQTKKTEQTENKNLRKATNYINSFLIYDIEETSENHYKVYYIESQQQWNDYGDTLVYCSRWGTTEVIEGDRWGEKLMVKKYDKISFVHDGCKEGFYGPTTATIKDWISDEKLHNDYESLNPEITQWFFYCHCAFIFDYDEIEKDIKENKDEYLWKTKICKYCIQ